MWVKFGKTRLAPTGRWENKDGELVSILCFNNDIPKIMAAIRKWIEEGDKK